MHPNYKSNELRLNIGGELIELNVDNLKKLMGYKDSKLEKMVNLTLDDRAN